LKANAAQFVAGARRAGESRGEQAFQIGALFALIIVPMLMLLTGWQLSQELARSRELREAVNRSYERRAQILEVFSLLQDAETGQRGYVITRDSRFLRPYEVATRQVNASLDALVETISREQPEQATIAARLESLVELKLRNLGDGLRALETRGSRAAQQGIATGPGRDQMEAIRDTVAELVSAEATALEQQLAEQQGRSDRTGLTIAALFVLLGAAVLVSGLLFLRHVQGRRELLAEVEDVAARQQAVLDSAIDAILTLNPSGTVETINAAGQRMFGYSADELPRRDLSAVLEMDTQRPGPFLERLIGPSRSLKAGVTQEMTGRRRNGETFPADVALGEMRLPEGLRFVAIIRDISERQRVAKLKEEFVSTVSHELRTPLTSIAGSLGLVSGGAAGEVPAPAKRLVNIALTNCQRLVRLINDVLDIEKMESGQVRFDLRPTPLGEIAARSVEETRGFAEALGVRLRLETDGSAPMIRGDTDRIVQVAVNLLSNAAKFSPAGQEVVLAVSTVDGKARLSVRDRGPGVPKDFQSRIFSKFAQADGSDTRQKGGTGLGLVIAREIVDRHGGRLWFENMPGAGATFNAEFAKIGEHAAVLEPGVRLLVCEDEVVTAAALREVLEDEGFIVDVAETLADAEQALRRADYACLVTDLKLPDGDGLTLIRRLRANLDVRRIPVIVVSGDAGRKRAQPGAGQLDIAAWMDKPVDPVRLKDAILAALAGAGRRPLILHVDDDPDMLQITAAALSGCGEVVSAASLAAARTALAARRPDLVVLDIALGDGSGLQLLPELETATGGRIPVVVFSAQSSDKALAARVESVLTKSRTSLSALARTVRTLVSQPAAEQAREDA
jgi:PAS domain S-box-containing protein